jgi:hypothetical protein
MVSDYGNETENIDNDEESEIDPLSETCSSSVSREVENVDEDVEKVRQLVYVISEYILCFS